MKYKFCNCSSLEGIRFKDKDSKIEKIFQNAKTSKYAFQATPN